MSGRPHGECRCGCGGTTKVIPQSRPRRGYVKGEFYSYIAGHNPKRPPKEAIQTNDGIGCVSLSKGYIAVVDAADYERVAKFTWHALIAKRPDGSIMNVYGVRNRFVNGKRTSLLLHRLILDIEDPAVEVDHKNSDGLDCRRQNLRVCNKPQNQANARKRIDNSTGFRGVGWHRATGKWSASIQIRKRSLWLGLFTTAKEAAKAYNDAAQEHLGEFAKLNVIP